MRSAPERIRTSGLSLRRAALYPLSYGRAGSTHSSRGPVDVEERVLGHLGAHVPERDHAAVRGGGARDPPDRATLVHDLGVGLRRLAGVDVQHSQRAVRVAAVVQPCDRLLSRVAPFREAHRALGQAGFGGEHAVVDVLPGKRRPGLDPHALELVGADRRLEAAVENLQPGRP